MPCLPVKCLYSTTNQKPKKQTNKQTIQANNKQSKKKTKNKKQKQANKQILIIIIIICLLDKHIQLAISSYIDNINRQQPNKQTDWYKIYRAKEVENTSWKCTVN